MHNSCRDLRNDAKSIFSACLDAVDPKRAIKRVVELKGNSLLINSQPAVQIEDFQRIWVVGAGKASAAMAQALEEILGELIRGGVISVKYGCGLSLSRAEVVEAGHPLPDDNGARAAREIIHLLESLTEKDLVISCISGGGSALLPAPANGITLRDKQSLTQLLLSVGADIEEINTVRKHVSRVKGGNLMRAAYPAFVINLMLSDVVGDDPSTIASGPFSPDDSTFGEVLAILDRYSLRGKVSLGLLRYILDGVTGKARETPKPGEKIFERVLNVVIGSNIVALNEGRRLAENLGYRTAILSSKIVGNTHEAAGFHAAIAAEIRSTGNPLAPPACVLSGGETTVTLTGKGLGGRNQHFALCLVRRAADIRDSIFLSAGTDGTDGPTDAAGAFVDSRSLERSLSVGMDPDVYLLNNDSYHFFQKLGDLIITGPTRTNVMDIRIILVA